MKNWEIVKYKMTAEQLKAKMIAEADVKLRSILSDVDPFWIRWSFWLEELDAKELKRNKIIEAFPTKVYDGSDWNMGRSVAIDECFEAYNNMRESLLNVIDEQQKEIEGLKEGINNLAKHIGKHTNS